MARVTAPTLRVATAMLPGDRPAHSTAAITGLVQRLMKSLLDPYRPELHYMRGPGPKWREKHAHMAPSWVGRAA